MAGRLANKQIVLGVTGGIAAYKSADLVRRLRENGADVRVVMTKSAQEFITPLTMQAVSGHPVHDDLFDLKAESAMGHIELARWADVILVAPTSADFMAKIANGQADDLLTTLTLATSAPIMIAPAMNQKMWTNETTQENLKILQSKKIKIVGPADGSQACGDVGPGRMIESEEIVKNIIELFEPNILQGKTVLITAGPTREAIDPIRYISNESSGKMGYAMAEAARDAGARVILISGPVSLPSPARVHQVNVVSAEDMFQAVKEHIADADLFFSVAAVSDYRAETKAKQKIAKKEPTFVLQLERTVDIVASIANLPKKPIIVGFAAETDNVLANAKAKLINKKLSMIIANLVGEGIGIGEDENAVTVIWDDQEKVFEKTTKKKLARELIALVHAVFFS